MVDEGKWPAAYERGPGFDSAEPLLKLKIDAKRKACNAEPVQVFRLLHKTFSEKELISE